MGKYRLRVDRAVTKALIEGVNIHIFAFCPTNFFWNQLSLELISKEIRRAEREYMNMHPPPPPPPINALVTALRVDDETA